MYQAPESSRFGKLGMRLFLTNCGNLICFTLSQHANQTLVLDHLSIMDIQKEWRINEYLKKKNIESKVFGPQLHVYDCNNLNL